MNFSIFNRTIFLQLFVIISILMIIPALVAFLERDYFVARTFLYSSCAGVIVYTLISIALSNIVKAQNNFEKLLSFILSYLILPIFMALPLVLSKTDVSLINAWLEMVSSFTTTGLSINNLDTSSGSAIQLWLGMVSWIGGIFFWICAICILLPLNISRFEIGANDLVQSSSIKRYKNNNSVLSSARHLIPIYLIITSALWLFLTLAGVSGFQALLMAMSVISTSGFDVMQNEVPNVFIIEGIVLIFFVFALSKSLFFRDTNERRNLRIFNDPEIRLAFIIILAVTGLFYAKSIFVLLSDNTDINIVVFLAELWGIFFTVTSYLVTMGTESKVWIDLPNSALAELSTVSVMGLAIIGGGVATTAGGVKLLRVYILYRNAAQEVDMMLHPNSIPSKKGKGSVSDNRNNRLMAWIFFMLFITALAFFTLIFSILFDDIAPGLALSVSALTTTGPLFANAGYEILLSEINQIFKIMLGLAMILGRLEILVIVALLFPSVWSK